MDRAGAPILCTTEKLGSRILRAVFDGPWSHVALAFEGTLGADGRVGWVEGHTELLAVDSALRKGQDGVKAYRLDAYVRMYGGTFRFFASEPPLPPTLRRAMAAAVDARLGTPYERSLGEIVGTLVGSPSRRPSATLFCTEFVAAIYQDLGLLPPKPHANTYRLRDFAKMRLPQRTGSVPHYTFVTRLDVS